MSPQLLPLPALRNWKQQLAGILPLSGLVEFIDVGMKIHLYELTGRVPLWNWPITPAGARLLLSSEDTHYACCLDRPARSRVLHCLDGKHGDLYNCRAPTTVRLSVLANSNAILIPNKSSNMARKKEGHQKLTVVRITQRAATPLNTSKGLSPRHWRYWIISAIGWACWIVLVVFAAMAGLYHGLTYLLIMPMTGLVVRVTHGYRPRQLVKPDDSSLDRLVIASDSLNASEWWAFYGQSSLINSIVNKPICRATKSVESKALRWILRLLIAGQWYLVVSSCALQDWNAFFVSFWIVLCAFESVFGYPAEANVKDWLRQDCNVICKHFQTVFSSRRALLSALIYLNADGKDECTKWIDPILVDTQDRKDWEATMLLAQSDISLVDQAEKDKDWWKYIVEAVDVGRDIKGSFGSQSKQLA